MGLIGQNGSVKKYTLRAHTCNGLATTTLFFFFFWVKYNLKKKLQFKTKVVQTLKAPKLKNLEAKKLKEKRNGGAIMSGAGVNGGEAVWAHWRSLSAVLNGADWSSMEPVKNEVAWWERRRRRVGVGGSRRPDPIGGSR